MIEYALLLVNLILNVTMLAAVFLLIDQVRTLRAVVGDHRKAQDLAAMALCEREDLRESVDMGEEYE